jgi:hypothetical protein
MVVFLGRFAFVFKNQAVKFSSAACHPIPASGYFKIVLVLVFA